MRSYGARSAAGFYLVVLMWLMLVPRTTSAQGTGASSIAGVVKDSSGGVLPGVTVEAASPALIEKVKIAVTDVDGEYRIIELRPGTYTVTFTLPGFSVLKRQGLELPSSFTAVLNVELQVGELEETITVTGESPLVDTQNLTQQRVITRNLIDAVPTAKSMLGIAALMPAVVTPPSAQDVGGTKGERSVRIAVHGGKTSDQRLLQDGMRYSQLGLEGTGRGFYVNPLSAQEIVIDVGTMGSAEYELGGAMVNSIPKDGGNRFSVSLFFGGTGHQLQGDNFSADLKAQGLTSINNIRRVYDVNGAVGGPIKKDRLWFFTAARLWGVTYQVANLYRDKSTDFSFVPDLTRPVYTPENDRAAGFRLTFQATPRNKLTFSYDKQFNVMESNTGALDRGTVAVEANNAYCQHVDLTQSTWTHPSSGRLLFEAGGTVMRYTYGGNLGVDPYLRDWKTCLNAQNDKVSINDTGLGFTYHGTGTRSLTQSHTLNGRFSVSYVTGAHQLKMGLFVMTDLGSHKTYSNRGPLDAGGLPVSYTFLNGVPTGLTQYASPLGTKITSRDYGLFVQDQWRVKRLTVNVGVRYDQIIERAAKTYLDGGVLIGPRLFDKVDNVPNWKDVNPRVGMAYDPFGDGKTALKFGVNRYVTAATIGVATTFAPANSTVASTTRSWTDTNRNFLPDCDLLNTALNRECGPMANANFGRLVSTTNPDPDWITGWGKRGYNWQMSVSVDRELMPGVAVNAGYFRTWYGNFTVTDNKLVTPADYDHYCITAPVDPRLPSNISGQQVCGLYDINPSKFGLVDNVVTLAQGYGKQTEIYNGADVNFAIRLPKGGSVSGGWNVGTSIQTGVSAGGASQSRTNNCFVVDSPQQLYNCDVRSPYQHRVKVSGSYPLPWWGLQASAVFQSLPGANYGAIYTATTAQIAPSLGRPLAGGTRSVTIDLLPPFSAFGPRLTQLDVRLTKKFKVGSGTAQANFDVYNVMNANTVLGYNNTLRAGTWLQPVQIYDARLAKFSVQFDF